MVASHASFPTSLLYLLFALSDPTSARPSKLNPLSHEIRAPSPNLSAYTPVLTDGSQSLPAPTGTLTYITLGRGTQNYTCSSTSTSTPAFLGATATLFDATTLLPALPASKGQAYLNDLPDKSVDAPTALIKQTGLPIIGQHFFTAVGVPTWTLSSGALMYGSGVGDIPAPADANAGPQGYGAVDWKALSAAAGSTGLGEVYRVETAGGKAPVSCAGFEGSTMLVQYAAMYWFYV